MSRIIVFIIYFIFVFLCLSVAIQSPFDSSFSSTLRVFGNMLANPLKGLYVIILIYFPFTFLFLILFGIYYIFFYTKKISTYLGLNKRLIFYLSILTSLVVVGIILRVLIEDKDYDSVFHYVYSLAYYHLSISGNHLLALFLFEFILPLAFLFFVCTPLLNKRNTNALLPDKSN